MNSPVRVRTLQTKISTRDRALLLFEAWRSASADADIEVRIGHTSTGEPAVLVDIAGEPHAFTAEEADVIAKIVEGSLAKFGQEAIAEGLDNLIIALRSGSKAARRAPHTEDR